MYMPRKSSSIDINEDDKPSTSASKARLSRIGRPLSMRAGGPSGRSMSASRASSLAAPQSNATSKSPAKTPNQIKTATSSSSSATLRPPTTRSSRSVCATPLRTPLGRSGSAPTIAGTAEKDRKANHELATQLLDKLHSHPQFRTEYLPNGLRTITTKQFVHTMLFFMRSVIGNARGQKLPTADISTDDIGKWLTQIRYPHMQSRSWLKTPNVPHAFHHLVELTNWLVTFIPDDPADAAPSFRCVDNLLDAEQCFPNVAYVRDFLAELLDMFVLWNQDQDIAAHKRQLLEQFIQHRLPHMPNACAHLASETQRIRREIEEVCGGEVVAGDGDGNAAPLTVDPAAEAELERQTKRLRQLEVEEERLREVCRTQSRAQRNVSTELRTQQRNNTQLETQCAQRSEAVRQQSMTSQRRDELLHVVQQRRDAVDARRAAIEQQKAAGHERHLTYTARLRRQIAVCAAVQQHVHTIGERLQSPELLAWSADSRSGAAEFGEQLERLVQRFQQMCAEDEERATVLRTKGSELTGELSRIRSDVDVREARRAEMQTLVERLTARRQELDALLGMTRVEFAKCSEEMRTAIEEAEQAERLERERLVGLLERWEALEQENERMLVGMEAVGNRMVDEKERRLAVGYGLLEELQTEVRKAQAELDKIKI